MKLKLYVPIVLVALVFAFLLIPHKKVHQYTSLHSKIGQDKEIEELPASFVKERAQYEFDMIKDPVTGTIPAGIFEKEFAVARTIPVKSIGVTARNARVNNLNTFLPAGPNNIGGRTRAIAYDQRYNGTTNKVIISGCVSGGIMRSNDGGQTWALVTPQNDIHTFTAIAQDPRPGFQDTWYAGGGEFSGESAGIIAGIQYLGFGIWKSTDNGTTWTKLTLAITDINGTALATGTLQAFDNAFDIVHRIAVNPTNGHVYIAGHRRLVRSTDGGTSFQVVFTGTVPATAETGQMDVTVSNTGRVFLAVNGGNPDLTIRGVWVSATGNANSFTRIAGGQSLGVDSVADWRNNNYTLTNNTYDPRRILITLAPSNNNIAYVFYDNGLSSSGTLPKPEADLFRLDISGNTYTWSNRSANMPDYPTGNLGNVDPLSIQEGYNMLVKVFPTDPNIVFIGGTNLYRSFDGFATVNSIAWINGYKNLSNAAQYPLGHPDQHELVFNPSIPAEAINGNDGGIQITADVNAGTGSFIFTPVSWSPLPRYQTLQYYYVAMDPDAGRNNFIGGAQDNGTLIREKIQLFTPLMDSNDHRKLISGDGSAVGISQVNTLSQTQYFYGSSQLGHTYRLSTTGQGGEIQPNGLTKNPSYPTEPGGEFTTNFRLDPDNTEDMYFINFNRLFRTTSASSTSAGGWTELTGVSAAVNPASPTTGTNIAIRGIAFTRGVYNSNHSLYIGTTNSKIFRIDDPRNISTTIAPSDITPPGATGNFQDISVNPNNDNEILAVASNYNVVSAWWTQNAKSANPTWVNVEGNISLFSFRSCAIISKKDAANNPVTEYYVGTSVGLYSTTNLSANPVTWVREGGYTLNFAVVQSIAYRPVDNVIVLGTHGNGMYYTFLGTPNVNIITSITPITNDRNFIRSVYPTISASRIQFATGNMIGVKTINIQLVDLTGRVIYIKQASYTSGSVPIDNLSSGTYILTIYSDDNKYRHIQKIIKH